MRLFIIARPAGDSDRRLMAVTSHSCIGKKPVNRESNGRSGSLPELPKRVNWEKEGIILGKEFSAEHYSFLSSQFLSATVN